MADMVNAITEWMGRRQSRRGFLAMCGKVGLATGLAMAGASRLALTAQAACCPGPPCANCNPEPDPCPAGCDPVNGFKCCDTATQVCHICTLCKCDPGPTFCYCENSTGNPCGPSGYCP